MKESLLFTREGIRTPDLLVRSQTLYPAELLAPIQKFFIATSCNILILSKKDFFSSFFLKIFFTAISLMYSEKDMLFCAYER